MGIREKDLCACERRKISPFLWIIMKTMTATNDKIKMSMMMKEDDVVGIIESSRGCIHENISA